MLTRYSTSQRLVRVVAILVTLIYLVPVAAHGWEWMGGRKAVFTITTIDAKQKAFEVAEQRSAVWAWTDSIRRERPNGGTTKATFEDLRPGVRVRVFGGGSSSPLGFVARQIIIVAPK